MLSIKGTVIYTGKQVLKDAFINFDHKSIVDVSTTSQGEILGEYPVITPAFIDPHCHIGMCRAGEPSNDEEANEKMDNFLTLANALDSVQMDDVSFSDSIEAGILYSCALPGSGNILGGGSAVIRNYGNTTSNALIEEAPISIKAALGYNPMSTREWKGKRPYTRMGALALFREKLYAVTKKMEKMAKDTENKDVDFSREDEILRDILYGKILLRVHVHKTDDIESFLRFTDEFKSIHSDYNIRFTIDHACDVHKIDIFQKLKERNISVIYGPMDSLAYKVELKHENWKNVRYLLESNVSFGLMSDHPVILQRMLLFQLRWFIRFGLNTQQAIEIITAKNAKILGIDTFLGTLEPNKWASFVCWNGDPFDLTSYPVTVYGEGRLLHPLPEISQ
ncbi:MAG: amidohydrolase family protein [Candidatus Kuenenia sp.]|nr:amidohydrolase family protein [Candidatus Kuenenia hertensis]